MLEDLRRLVRTEASGARQGGSSLITIDEESLIAGSSMDPIESIAWVSRQIAYYSELAIFRYMDLVERMALLPGKKSVVLFRSGLRMDRESSPLMNRLLAAAVRNRVAFYTIDTRGLKDSSPDQPSGAMALAARMYRYLPDPMHDNRRLIESQEGLAVLAEDTGGQAVLNNNNPGEILSRVVEDSHAYYVLSFYPGEPSRKGKFRKIEVSLRNQDGCRISCVPGYHDLGPLPEQNSGERLLSLKEAMLTSSSRELRLSIEPEVLADPEGNPLLCLSAAVPAEDFIPAGKKGKLKIEAELLLQLVNKYSLNMPLYANAQLKHTVKTDEPAGGGEVSRLSYRTALSLVPGQYQLKGIVRDRESGRHGVFSTWITVSDFNNAASVPSSLILTRYAVPLDPDNRDDQVNRVLAVGDTVYYPQAEREFQRGEVVYALFRLYHATPEDRAWASRGIQTGLIRDDALVDKLLIHGNTHSDPGSDILTYLLMFETVNLDPGEYTFVVMLPNHPARVRQQLEETLRIIP